MDPARSERPASDTLTGAERDARIEQLLLAGLDHYFAADYDQAINLWTRVLFLDRHHDRARAYIERARSAQAERQRESEALLHQGLDALTRGDVTQARALVADALDRGASRDLALGVLDRIERLGAAAEEPRQRPAPRASWLRARRMEESAARMSADPSRTWRGQPAPLSRRATLALATAVVAAIVLGVWGVTLSDVGAGLFTRRAPQSAPVTVPTVDPLPLASASELFMSRSEALFRSGRLRDALRELDRVPIGDPARTEADRLRADIQRELLATAAADARPTNEVP